MVYDIRKIEKEDLENYDRSLASLYGVSPDLLGTEPVTVLELPSRVSNRIKFTGARTVSEFFSLTVGQLAFLDGIGLKSFNDIGVALSKYLNACGSVPSESRFFLEYEKMRIDQFGLSARSVNGLMKAGIRTFADLIPLTEEDILNMRGLGVKSVSEIMRFLREMCGISPSVSGEDSLLDMEIRTAAAEMPQSLGMDERYWTGMLRGVVSDTGLKQFSEVVVRLYEREDVRERARRFVGNFIDGHEGCVAVNQLASMLPSHLYNTQVFDSLLNEMADKNILTVSDGVVRGVYPSAADLVDGIDDERTRTMIKARFAGESYADIGKKYGKVTRERARQIIRKGLSRLPRVREDNYRRLFAGYLITKEELSRIFGEPESAYYYLCAVDNVSSTLKKPLVEALADPAVSAYLKDMIEATAPKNYVKINGELVKLSRSALISYYVKRYCVGVTTMKSFMRGYREFLNTNGFDGEKFRVNSLSTVENDFQSEDDTLWSKGHKFRAYDIKARDMDRLWESLDIEKYKGLEISALLLFRGNTALMREYDVRNEYELHNLLRKTAEGRIEGLEFGRMPILSVDCPETARLDQMKKLFYSLIPTDIETLCGEYEKKYGVRSSIMRNAFVDVFSDYYRGGRFCGRLSALPDKTIAELKESFTEDMYTFAEVNSILDSVAPELSGKVVDAYNMNRLGYRMFSGYVVSVRYQSAAEYFRTLLTSADTVDLTGSIEELRRIVEFTRAEYSLIADRKIIETEFGRFVSVENNPYGFTPDALDDFCRKVSEFVPSNALFTVTKLVNDGFDHLLMGCGLGEYGLCSVLSGYYGFYSCRAGDTRLFCNGVKRVSYSELIPEIAAGREEIGIEEICRQVYERYGISVRKHRILLCAAKAGMETDNEKGVIRVPRGKALA